MRAEPRFDFGTGHALAEVERLKDALVGAIGSPKDRDRMDEVIPLVLASYRERAQVAEARLKAVVEILTHPNGEFPNQVVRVQEALAAAKEKP